MTFLFLKQMKCDLEYSNILNECTTLYDNELRTSIAEYLIFVSQKKIQELHTNAKRKAIAKVCSGDQS